MVVRVNPVLIVESLASAPGGATPIPSVHLTIRAIDGSVVATAITDAQGAFHVSDLPIGLLTVEVRLDAQAAEPEGTVAFTSIAGATLGLGGTHGITRDEAAAAVLDGLSSEHLVLGTMQPLPEGTVIQPRGFSPKDPQFARTLAAPAYFFLIDPEPTTRFSHDLVYVLVDAASGALDRVEGVPERPRVNGEAIWSSDLDYCSHPGFDPRTIDVGIDPDAVPDVIEAVPSDEVVQLPAGAALGAMPAMSAIQGVFPFPYGGPEGVFVILVRASADSAVRADWLAMTRYFKSQGIPMENMLSVLPGLQRGPADALRDYDVSLSIQNGKIQERLNIGLASTLIVYISGHQNKQKDPQTGISAAQGDVTWELDGGREMEITPPRLKLKTTPACKLRVILDICYAELFGAKLVEDMDTLPEDERPDLLVLCASEIDQTATQVPSVVSFLTAGLLNTGGTFTNRIRNHARISGGDFTNVLDSTGTMINENLDPFFQDAVAIIRRNQPDRCLGASDPGESIGFLLRGPELLGRGAGASQPNQRATTSGAGAFGITGPFFLVGGTRDVEIPLPPGVPPPPPGTPLPTQATVSVVLFDALGEELKLLALGSPPGSSVSAAILSHVDTGGSSQLQQAAPARTDVLISYGSILLTVTGWNAKIDDFGMSQISPQVTNVTDVAPYGGDPESGGGTISWFGGNAVLFVEYDPSSQLFVSKGSIGSSQFTGASGAPVSAFRWQAGGQTVFVTDGQPGELWSHAGGTANATKIGDLGNGPRQIRFLGEIGVVSNFDSGTLTVVRRQSNGTVTILGTVDVGDGPIGLDLRSSAGNIEVLSTGFGDHTYTFTVLSPTGSVIGTPTTRSVPEGGLNPVHGVFVNADGTRISVSCNGSDEVLLFDLPPG